MYLVQRERTKVVLERDELRKEVEDLKKELEQIREVGPGSLNSMTPER